VLTAPPEFYGLFRLRWVSNSHACFVAAEKCHILPTSCNKTQLQEALIHARFEEASQLIEKQSEAQLVECFEGKDGCLKSCLHVIAALSDRELATKLCSQLLQMIKNPLNREYLLNITTVEQIRRWKVDARLAAIHIAACSGNAGVVRLLCHEYGVDVNCNTGETLEEKPRKGSWRRTSRCSESVAGPPRRCECKSY